MTNEQAVTIHEAQAVGHVQRFDREKLDLLKATVAAGTSDTEFALFTAVCERTGLDPFARQIHCVMRNVKDGDRWVKRMTIQTGIDGFRLIAQRTGQYRGQVGPEWCGADGEWRDVWLSSEPPAAARVGILRHGFDAPAWGVATLTSYQQTTNDGKLTAMWRRMPDVLLAKCAEAQALRKAFPQELSGLLGDEEMDQAARGDAEEAPPKKANQAAPRRRQSSIPPPRGNPSREEFERDDDAPGAAEGTVIEGELVDEPAPAKPPKDEPPISRFWKDTRALGITREQVVEHVGHERFEELDADTLGELLIQLRDKHGKTQPALGV